MEKQTHRETVVGKLAEWDITLSDSEIEQLLHEYKNLLRCEKIIEDMLQQRRIANGMSWPESEPILIRCIEKMRRLT